MKYYVTADVHGFFSELKAALTEQGLDACTPLSKKVNCIVIED